MLMDYICGICKEKSRKRSFQKFQESNSDTIIDIGKIKRRKLEFLVNEYLLVNEDKKLIVKTGRT